MRAVTWHGKRDVRVDTVPDPTIEKPTDAIVRITSTGICGSDLHLYEVLGPFMGEGDILGHEPMGIVEEVGADVTHIAKGDRVVIPFNISCGHCFMCDHGLQSQCETTQVNDQGMGAALFGYTKLYGQVPGGQAEFLRVPQAQYGPIKVPEGPPDDRFVYLSDVLPTAWQAVEYANIPEGGTVAVFGLGPIGDMSHARGQAQGRARDRHRPRARADHPRAGERDRGARPLRPRRHRRVAARAHRRPRAGLDHRRGRDGGARREARRGGAEVVGLIPDAIASKMMEKAAVDRLVVIHTAIEAIRRGGTISLSGVYGGMLDPLPLMTMFDKQINLRMGQANVKRWIHDIMPLVEDEDVLGVEQFATHRLPLDAAPEAYETFQKKQDGAVKILLQPAA